MAVLLYRTDSRHSRTNLLLIQFCSNGDEWCGVGGSEGGGMYGMCDGGGGGGGGGVCPPLSLAGWPATTSMCCPGLVWSDEPGPLVCSL